MIVYHGSILEIRNPEIAYSKRNLDFGAGFYTTSVKEQAERWALRKAMRFGGMPTVNVYEASDMSTFRVKKFKGTDGEWLQFVVNCRNGEEYYKEYDAVMGNVANDDIFKCVNMYMKGYWDEERTLKEIRFYKNNDQIVFITQEIINAVLLFRESYEVIR